MESDATGEQDLSVAVSGDALEAELAQDALEAELAQDALEAELAQAVEALGGADALAAAFGEAAAHAGEPGVEDEAELAAAGEIAWSEVQVQRGPA